MVCIKFETMKSILLLTLSVVLLNCGTKKETTAVAETEPSTTQEVSKLDVQPLVIKQGVDFTTGAEYSVKEASTGGDILQLVVSYSGGCEDHEFTLFTNGAMMKSMPPQMNLTLSHNNNGDTCRGLLTDTLAFDLSKIRAGKEGTIILRLRNYDSKIVYTY